MDIQENILKDLVLKNDLQYVMNDEEKSFFLKMTSDEIACTRKQILNSIQNKDLSLDVLEDYINYLKDVEYRRYLNQEGRTLTLSMQMEKLTELEGKCTQMIINIAKGMSTCENLLGPSVHDTYGIRAKS